MLFRSKESRSGVREVICEEAPERGSVGATTVTVAIWASVSASSRIPCAWTPSSLVSSIFIVYRFKVYSRTSLVVSHSRALALGDDLLELDTKLQSRVRVDLARASLAIGSVSYTHLDVYKRQPPCDPAVRCRQRETLLSHCRGRASLPRAHHCGQLSGWYR